MGQKGGATRRAQTELPDAEIIARYMTGESEKSLAEAFDVSRQVIRARLRLANVPIRSPLEANRLLAQSRTPEEHKHNTKAAHQASRGREHTVEEKTRRAQTRQARQTHTSPYELLFKEWLQSRGIETIPQQAIGVLFAKTRFRIGHFSLTVVARASSPQWCS
ncbi:MAG: hypothetical protein WCP31_05775 [Chloroflexales bacterium]